MTFSISYSLETETLGLLVSLEDLGQGRYLPRGFYVLPNPSPPINLPISVIPHLDYSSIAPWSDYLPENFPRLLPQLQPLLTPTHLPLPSLSKITRLFHLIKPHLFSPYYRKLWNQAHFQIHPVRYGTYSYWTYGQKPTDIHLFIRQNQPPEVLVEVALSSILHLQPPPSQTWREQEAISDYLTSLTLKKNYLGTLYRVAKTDTGLLTKSIDYLRELQAPIGELLFEKDDVLYFRNQILNPLLSPSERLLLSALIRSDHQPLSYDQLAQFVYGSQVDLKYSLWGLRKTIQRLRQKLTMIGVPANLIQNLSGQGYLLN